MQQIRTRTCFRQTELTKKIPPTLKYLFLILPVFITASLFAQRGNNVILTGKIAPEIATEAELRLVDNYVAYSTRIVPVTFDESGNFSTQLEITSPRPAELEVAGRRIPIFLQPGQNSRLEILQRGEDSFVPKYLRYGQAANVYLLNFENAFSGFDEEAMSRRIATLPPVAFRQLVDSIHYEKQLFLNAYTYDIGAANELSDEFLRYARAEIDYWWARQLLRYRFENPDMRANPREVPESFNDFFTQMELNDPGAMNSGEYNRFLILLTRFINQNPMYVVDFGRMSATGLNVNEPSPAFFRGPFGVPLFVLLSPGTKLMPAADSVRRAVLRQKHPLRYYPMRRTDNSLLYVQAAGLGSIARPAPRIEINEYRRVSERKAVREVVQAKLHGLKMYQDPVKQDDVVGRMDKWEIAENLLNETTDALRYEHNGEVFLAKYYKIRRKNGTEGWVSGWGIDRQQKIVVVREAGNQAIFTDYITYENARKILQDEPLLFVLARDLYTRIQREEDPGLRNDLVGFITENPIAEYDRVLLDAFNQKAREVAGMDPISEIELATGNRLPPRADMPTRRWVVSRTVERAGPGVVAEINDRPVLQTVAEPQARFVELSVPECGTAPIATSIGYPAETAGANELQLLLTTNLLTDRQQTFRPERQPDGSYRFELALSRPTAGTLRLGGKSMPVYLEPGDRLRLQLSQRDLTKLKYSGQGADHNDYLLKFQENFGGDRHSLRSQVRGLRPEQFGSFLADRRAEREDFLRQNSQNLSGDFYGYAQAEIDQWYALRLLQFPTEYVRQKNLSSPPALPETYYDPLPQYARDVPGALPNSTYREFLKRYVGYVNSTDPASARDPQSFIFGSFSGAARDYLQARFYHNEVNRGRVENVATELRDFVADCSRFSYAETLQTAYNRNGKLRAGTLAPDFQVADKAGRPVRLSDYRGKVVYLDFWATWCGPCLLSLPHTQRLKREMADEPVAFLYVNLDKQASKWRKFVENRELNGVHLHPSDGRGYESQIAQSYGVKALPTYFVIGKDGRIVLNSTKQGGLRLEDTIRGALAE